MVSHRRGMLSSVLGLLLLGSAIASCADEEPQDPNGSSLRIDLDQGLDARQVLIRTSLDVRGIRPTQQELAAVTSDPQTLDQVIEDFVDHPGFARRVKAIFAGALRTRQDAYPFGTYSLGLSPDDEFRLQEAIAEEPLNLIAHVAVDDAPFSEVLTADYTVVDDILLDVWPVTEVETQPTSLSVGQSMARYTDARPAAGVLSTNAFFWRHTSTLENANRGRSNAISRAFLCEDYLDRPIDFPKDVDLTNSEAITTAIRTNPGCQACHATLDPFASHLWGFMYLSDDAQGWLSYQPQNENLWKQETEAQPAFFGAATDGTLSGLATAIASDERFVSCTVKRVYEGLLDRPVALSDEGQLVAHREAFVGSGLSLKSLVRSVIADPAYRGRTTRSAYGATPEGVPVKLLSPELLTQSIGDLTGYRLTFLGRDATSVDYIVRALAGGSESGPASSPSLGHALVHRRIAEGAARTLVDVPELVKGEITGSRVGQLLAEVDLNAAPEPATLVALVAEIRTQVISPDSEEVAALIALWTSVANQTDADDAWTAILTTLLADPQVAVY